ncbi:hypothetical protein D9M69_611530 [compost metagenome]
MAITGSATTIVPCTNRDLEVWDALPMALMKFAALLAKKSRMVRSSSKSWPMAVSPLPMIPFTCCNIRAKKFAPSWKKPRIMGFTLQLTHIQTPPFAVQLNAVSNLLNIAIS